MKNYSKEFWLRGAYITMGTHWKDWSLPLRIYWNRYRGYTSEKRFIDVNIDFLCFTIIVETFGGKK